MYHLQLQQKHLSAILAHSQLLIGLSALVAKFAEDDIVITNITTSRPQDSGVPITVVNDKQDRYMELQRAPWPIDAKKQSVELAIVQY